MGIWVALSGGVDSAVTAALMLERGAEVTGVTLDLGIDPGAVESAASVAKWLGMAHVVIDAAREFEKRVVGPFVQAYAAGVTPNPCVVCNEEIKLGLLLQAARDGGADQLVTGHYARIVETAGGPRIARAIDPRKDQSYFLYRIAPGILPLIGFPLGEYRKDEVRARAAALGLPVAKRPDSQDVCFLGNRTAGQFVADRAPEACAPGPVLDTRGNTIGVHHGLCHYTVGQRKGLPGGAGPLFVTEVLPGENAVVASRREDCLTRRVVAVDAVWADDRADDRTDDRTDDRLLHVAACVRAGSSPVRARVVRSGSRLELTLDEPVCAAPGQAVVCYDGDVVVGGGTIVREHLA